MMGLRLLLVNDDRILCGVPLSSNNWVKNKLEEDIYAEYAERLDRCENFQEVFSLVKRSVKQTLNRERVGLMLYLMDLPLGLGAFHGVGTNGIVMNKTLLEEVTRSANSKREVNSFVYSILLHEYIHALGCIDERETRRITYEVSKESFGPYHIATKMAETGPWEYLKLNPLDTNRHYGREIEIVRNFEVPEHRYIV